MTIDKNSSGSFVEKDHKLTHFFQDGCPEWMGDEFAEKSGITHTLETRDGGRGIKLLKTVAYIVVDEDHMGDPVFAKWNISNLRDYT